MYKVSKRSARVASVIRKLLIDCLRMKLSDSMIRNISVTCVDVSPDLRNAKIFITPSFDVKNKSELMKRLNDNIFYIKKEIAKNSELRVVPKLTFHLDAFLAKANELNDLIGQSRLNESNV